MNTTIVYLDDADYAVQQISPLRGQTGGHWILVGCAPRMTHRISKWVSHSARENWRAKWADKLFAQVLPWLGRSSTDVTTVLAKGPLPELAEQLQATHGVAQVVDARRPKAAPAPRGGHNPSSLLAGLSALFVLALAD